MRRPEANLCPECGAEVKIRLVEGYTSGQRLGRPTGAKGEDTSYIERECPSHGVVTPVVGIEAQATYDAWVAWIKTLPAKVGDFEITRNGVCDPYGNHLFGLPEQIVPDFPAWVQEMWDRIGHVE